MSIHSETRTWHDKNVQSLKRDQSTLFHFHFFYNVMELTFIRHILSFDFNGGISGGIFNSGGIFSVERNNLQLLYMNVVVIKIGKLGRVFSFL